jgi:hypothetical protein
VTVAGLVNDPLSRRCGRGPLWSAAGYVFVERGRRQPEIRITARQHFGATAYQHDSNA